jgi:hypothetical protein
MEKESASCSTWLKRLPLIMLVILLLFFLCIGAASGDVAFPLMMVLYALMVIVFIAEVVLLIVCRKSTAKAGPIMFVLLIAAMVALALPQVGAEKAKPYDAAARVDVKHAATFCECYYAGEQKYPENLDKFGTYKIGEDAPDKPSNGVKFEYVLNKDKDSFVITTYHPEGKRIYKWIHGDSLHSCCVSQRGATGLFSRLRD